MQYEKKMGRVDATYLESFCTTHGFPLRRLNVRCGLPYRALCKETVFLSHVLEEVCGLALSPEFLCDAMLTTIVFSAGGLIRRTIGWPSLTPTTVRASRRTSFRVLVVLLPSTFLLVRRLDSVQTVRASSSRGTALTIPGLAALARAVSLCSRWPSRSGMLFSFVCGSMLVSGLFCAVPNLLPVMLL